MAITYFGSAIWSYSLLRTGAILFTIVPAMIITSACRGVALATSNPNLLQSYFAEAVLIISMAQQLVPKTNGHKELLRAQLITSSNLLINTPPVGVLCTSPGNDVPSRPPPAREAVIALASLFEMILLLSAFCSNKGCALGSTPSVEL